MIRHLVILAIGVAIWAAAYAVPGHTGGWGILRGLMIAAGSMTAGFQTGRVERELRDRIGMRWRWWRNRRNARRGRGWASVGDPSARHMNCRCTIKPTTKEE